MADAKRYILYARKSTDVEDKQVRSIDAQLSELHEFAKRNAIYISEVVVEKESAKTPGKRREFNAMLDCIESGESDGILAWHPDRLARNMTDGGRVIDLIDTGKINALRFPTFWFDTTPQGKFMLSMAFSQSKYYIDSMAENTKRGFREKVRRGEYPGWAPIGYLNDHRIKRIIIDTERAPVIRQVFERYATGTETIDTTRLFLASNGIRTRNGKLISRAGITNLLRNPIYYGQFQYAGEIYDGVHDPIISKHLFDQTQDVLKRRWKWSPAKHTKIPKPYLGLLRCAECGGAITAEVQKGHTYYRCSKKGVIRRRCTQPYIREEVLDSEISKILSPFALREDWANDMLARVDLEERQASSDSASLIAQARKQIDELQLKIGRLLDLRLDAAIDAKTYTDRKAKLMGQKKTHEEEIERLSNGQKPWLEPLRNWILTAKHVGNIAKTGSLSERKSLAKEIFGSNLFLDRKKPSGVATKAWPYLVEPEFCRQLVHLYEAARTFYREPPSP